MILSMLSWRMFAAFLIFAGRRRVRAFSNEWSGVGFLLPAKRIRRRIRRPKKEMNLKPTTSRACSCFWGYMKKKHRQVRKVLCGRCRLLSHGHMVTAVGGNGGYAGGKQFAIAEELREKLTHFRHEKAIIVKLVDIVDFNGSFLAHVRDLAAANPIILVVNKVDLLPKGTDFNYVGDWVVDTTIRKKLNSLQKWYGIGTTLHRRVMKGRRGHG